MRTQVNHAAAVMAAALLLGLAGGAGAADAAPAAAAAAPDREAYRPRQDVVEKDAQTKVIDGVEYRLFWADDFDGTALDAGRWQPRFPKPKASFDSAARILRTHDETFLDGEGNLVVAMRALKRDEALPYAVDDAMRAAIAAVAEDQWISTTNSLVATTRFRYGYIEVRWKPATVAGPGFCVWFPYTYDGTPRTTEIDIFEGTLYARGSKVDYKSSTIHFYPGGWKERSEIERVHNYMSFQRTRPAEFTTEDVQALLGDIILSRRDFRYDPASPRLIDNSADGQTRVVYYHGDDDRFLFDDGQYHTVALLWTPERYTFFYDHEAIGSLDQGISHMPQQLILSLRRMGGDMWLDTTIGIVADPGRADPRRTPGRTLVDYVRVYKLPEDIAAIQAEAAAAAAPPSPAEALRKAIVQRLATAAVSLPEGKTGIGDAEITVDFDAAPDGWPQVVLPLQGTAPLACKGVSAEVTYLAEDGANLALSMAVPDWQKAGVAGASRWIYLVPGQPTTCALAFETQTAPDGAVALRLALKAPTQAHRLRLRDLRLIPAE